jgi:5'-nucleotidase
MGKQPVTVPPERDIFCNRTLNMRAIEAIGYDMDYTLIHYREDAWEDRAYEHIRAKFLQRGWPVEGLRFDPEMMERGLVLDVELGNILEANRFGFIKQACHGTRRLPFQEVRQAYARTIVELDAPRFFFLTTLFSLSEGCMYAQLVDLLDRGELPGAMGYADLHRTVRRSLDEAHMEGELKAEILADPDSYVVPDAEAPLALLDQKKAGKRLLLITNSDWPYTRALMSYAYDPHLPEGMTWRDLFDLVVVSARKPAFFSGSAPALEVVGEGDLLRPINGPPKKGGTYHGGNAAQVERLLGLSGDRILYVGDHVFGDVQASKSILRWRTALILRELEREITAQGKVQAEQEEIGRLMAQKETLELEQCRLRLDQQRSKQGYGPRPKTGHGDRARRLKALRAELEALDARIGPLAASSGKVGNRWWGPLMRAGNDKSLLTRQVERSADIYTSRVSNFLLRTPFAYLRPPRGCMPHDRG